MKYQELFSLKKYFTMLPAKILLGYLKISYCYGNILGVIFRFMLSLTSCRNCMVIDDQFNVLPFSSHSLNIQPVPAKSLVSITLFY